jgi:hypothetical protein
MSSWATMLGRIGQTTERPYEFEDDEKVVQFPQRIEELGREEGQITRMLVEVYGDLSKLVNQRNELVERRNQVRERIAAWAREHGVKADAVTEEPLP